MPFELFMTNKALIQAMRKVSKQTIPEGFLCKTFSCPFFFAAYYYGFTSFNSASKMKNNNIEKAALWHFLKMAFLMSYYLLFLLFLLL